MGRKSVDMEAVAAADVAARLVELGDAGQRAVLMRFFKTGPGEYGEGDVFLGVKVPQVRALVKWARLRVPLDGVAALLGSSWHEVRLAGFLLLAEEMRAALPRAKDSADVAAAKAARRGVVAGFYLEHARRANNWDLVDLSCPYILGPHLLLDCGGGLPVLLRLADSGNLWEQRIAMVTTLHFIRQGVYAPTLELAERLMGHRHDLMHKAVGWMLREVGKRDAELLRGFLERNCRRMPRTALRYAIEKFGEPERRAWLAK